MFAEKIKKQVLFIVVFIIIVFVAYNFRIFITDPIIEIKDFANSDNLVVSKQSYILEGIVPNSVYISINGNEVLLDRKYSFVKKLYLYPYENTFHIKSISNIGTISERDIMIYME